MYLKCVNGMWYYPFRGLNGKQTMRSMGTRDRMEAERRASLFKASLQERKKQIKYHNMMCAMGLETSMQTFPQMPFIQQAGTMQLATPSIQSIQPIQCIPQENGDSIFETRKKDQPKSRKRTKLKELYEIAKKYRTLSSSHQKIFNAFMVSVSPLCYADEITQDVALDYMTKNYNEKSAKTYNNVKSSLDVIFRAALVEAGLERSPFENILNRRLDDVDHHRGFTDKEVSMIFSFLSKKGNEYYNCISKIAYYTGLRLESCKSLSPSHIRDGVITIMPGKTSRYGRSVQIPLLPQLQDYLSTIRPPANEPYCHAFPEPTREWKSSGKTWFSGALDELGILDNEEGTASFHSWRVTFITKLSENGVDDRVIRGIVGHTDQKVTDLYNHDIASAKKAFSNLSI